LFSSGVRRGVEGDLVQLALALDGVAHDERLKLATLRVRDAHGRVDVVRADDRDLQGLAARGDGGELAALPEELFFRSAQRLHVARRGGDGERHVVERVGGQLLQLALRVADAAAQGDGRGARRGLAQVVRLDARRGRAGEEAEKRRQPGVGRPQKHE